MPLVGARQPLLAKRILPHPARSRLRRRGFLSPTAKMYVPSDSKSPERKAAEALTTFFTFVACKIILAQLEGSGRGSLASYNAQGYQDLMDFLQKNPIKDGDEWLAKLMTHNQLLGVRIMEVREAYCQEDFEWDECHRLAVKGVKDANVRLMREYAAERFGKVTTRPGTDTQAESRSK